MKGISVGDIKRFCNNYDGNTKIYMSCYTKEFSKTCDVSMVENITGVYSTDLVIDYVIDHTLDKQKTMNVSEFISEIHDIDEDAILEKDIDDGFFYAGLGFMVHNENGFLVFG